MTGPAWIRLADGVLPRRGALVWVAVADARSGLVVPVLAKRAPGGWIDLRRRRRLAGVTHWRPVDAPTPPT